MLGRSGNLYHVMYLAPFNDKMIKIYDVSDHIQMDDNISPTVPYKAI